MKSTAHDAAVTGHIANFLKSTYMHILSLLGEALIASGPAIVGSFLGASEVGKEMSSHL